MFSSTNASTPGASTQIHNCVPKPFKLPACGLSLRPIIIEKNNWHFLIESVHNSLVPKMICFSYDDSPASVDLIRFTSI